MNLHEAIRARRTVHRFSVGPVAEEVVERALAAAILAPNHKTTWPFRFVVPGPAARERLVQVGVRLKSAKRGPSPELEQAVRADMATPDRLIVVAQVLASDPGRVEEDYATCAAAVQNLLLSLTADGVGSKWGTGGPTRDPETFEILGLDPATHKIVAFVWAGVPAGEAAAPARPPLDALVSRPG